MNRYLIGACAALVLALGLSLRSCSVANNSLAQAKATVDSMTALRVHAEQQSRADSLALNDARRQYIASRDSISLARQRARLESSVAAKNVSLVSDSLRVLLEGQSAAQEALARLDEAVRLGAEAKDREIAAADSATAVERSLRLATERALASERSAHQAASEENSALRRQVSAINHARSVDRLVSGTVVVAIITTVVLTR